MGALLGFAGGVAGPCFLCLGVLLTWVAASPPWGLQGFSQGNRQELSTALSCGRNLVGILAKYGGVEIREGKVFPLEDVLGKED